MAHFDLAWLGCDLKTGSIIAELPEVNPSGRFGVILGDHTTAQFQVPLPARPSTGAPPIDYEAATEPGRTMLVAVVDGEPLWAGIILDNRGGSASSGTLACVSLEGYLGRRYVTDHKWVQQDEASVIAAGLLADGNTVEGIGFTLDAPATGVKRDRQYFGTDDKTVKAALTELMGVLDGPEWTVALKWADANQTKVGKIFRVRKRIGYAAPTSGPAASFDTAGESEASYELVSSYSDGDGANHILAVSSGEGSARPASAPARDAALFLAGWPRYEFRFTPSTSITNVSTLNSHAAAALKLMGRGAQAISITARAFVTPMVGVHFGIGDDVGFRLTGHRHPDPAAPYAGVARVVGWELDPLAETLHPTLVLPGEEALPETVIAGPLETAVPPPAQPAAVALDGAPGRGAAPRYLPGPAGGGAK